MTTSRREFLGELGALALLGVRLDRPDLVLCNGNVVTVDGARPRAQAVAVAAGHSVLGRDPLREDPHSLVTMVGGRWVYES